MFGIAGKFSVHRLYVVAVKYTYLTRFIKLWPNMYSDVVATSIVRYNHFTVIGKVNVWQPQNNDCLLWCNGHF